MDPDELISATIAVYPLQAESEAAVHRAIDAIESRDVETQVGPMSTLVTGTADEVFGSLRAAFEAAASTGGVVMHAAVSNVCPLPHRRHHR